MSRKRLGRQKPTQSYILRYKTSRGLLAVALCFGKDKKVVEKEKVILLRIISHLRLYPSFFTLCLANDHRC